jgi:kinetochore protein Spc7/SPC105
VFDASSFRSDAQPETASDQANTRIDLWYIAGNRELNPLPVTAEKEFFLQNIREHCRCLPQAKTSIRDLLNVVSASWTKALKINDEISALSLDLPTTTTKTSDNAILVSSSLLLKPLATKVEFKFHMVAVSTGEGVDIEVFADAAVVYGERFNEKKMGEFILSRIGNGTDDSRASWRSAVLEMEEKLLARGRK